MVRYNSGILTPPLIDPNHETINAA